MPRCFMSILLLALLLWPWPGLAATFTVTNTSDSDPGSLRAAILGATDGDVIDLTTQSGTITLTTLELSIPENLTIIGPGANNLTVSGSGVRCFNITADSVTLSGLTIAQGNAGTGNGGCILIGSLASLRLEDCSVENGRAQNGACIYSAGSLTMSRSTVHFGTAVAYGGGIASYGTLDLEGCTLNDCSAGMNGGGLYLPAGSATLTRCSIVHCVATTAGGGIGCENATMQMRDCLIRDCVADYGGGFFYNAPGGGIATLVNCTLASNVANDAGGGAHVTGTMQASFCTITGNSAVSGGDSIYFNSGTSTIKNSILAGNPIADAASDYVGDLYVNFLGYNVLSGDPKLAVGPEGFLPEPGSPALDSVTDCTNVGGTTPVLLDARGVNRPQGSACDAGAFEFQLPVADAGADRSVHKGDDVFLDGATSTPGDDGMDTWQWAQTGGLPIVTLTDEDTDCATFKAPEVDQDTLLTFKLVVTTNKSNTAEDTVAVTVIGTSNNSGSSGGGGGGGGCAVSPAAGYNPLGLDWLLLLAAMLLVRLRRPALRKPIRAN
ncbi:PKD domain-containing protein [Desulfocurvibacter africanus]|uniref:Right handed beta helix domain-containing protein n=1 Tax=Desulfocurvibacter africanus subsp. africanus str. Walvis Bay TaxID=690850 RepID=F3YXK6_DESAF|nr:right-handed parallel beta-helix repeat-containing protein [Desulfocurvibacter africanus]EGJ51783.1 hypothetical protein Desaf_3499 [Desulfocurvibacter africanus subsp. africanus str. Walvis Bay]